MFSNNSQIINRIKGTVDPRTGKVIVPADAVATQSYLRLEASIQGTQGSVAFTVASNAGVAPNVTERRLDLSDMFTVTHWGLFLMKAGTTTTATQAQISQAQLYTTPNPLVFTGAGEAAALECITSNSNLTVTIDRNQIVPAFDTLRFRRAGLAQKLVGTTTGGTPAQFDSWDGPNYGFAEVDPQFTISGSGNNNITLNLATSTATSGTSSQNFVVLIMRGVLWQNSSRAAQ